MIEAGTCANRYTSVCFASIFRIVVLFYIDADDTTCKSTRKMHRQLLFTSQHTCPIPSHLGLSNTRLLLFFTDTVYQATLWTHIEPSVGMVCSCLPSIRGLFPAFSFTKSSSQGTSKFSHGASANHDVTRSNQKSLSYIKMQDIATSRAESDEEDLVPKDELPESERGITVQTDIVINHAPNNTRGDPWRGAVRMEK